MKKRPPLLGYNHNVRHAGQTFHVQTEDSGVARTCLTTHVFLQGVIVATARTRYEAQEGEGEVLRRMQEQHKTMLKQLRAGVFDGQVPVLAPQATLAVAPQVTHDAPPGPSLVGQLLQRLDEPGATVATTAPYATRPRAPAPLSDAELAELVDLAAGTLEGGFARSGHSGAIRIEEEGPVLELVAEPPSEEEMLLDRPVPQAASTETPAQGSRPPLPPVQQAAEPLPLPPKEEGLRNLLLTPEGMPPLPEVPTRVRLIPARQQSSPGVAGRALRTTAQRLDAVGVRARGTAEGVVMKRPHVVGEATPTRPTEAAPTSSRFGTDPKMPMPQGDERSLDQLVLAYLADDQNKKK